MSTSMRAARGVPTELAFTSSQAATYLGVSLATVRSRVNLTSVGGIDLRVAAAPVLTPLTSASNVQGKGDG